MGTQAQALPFGNICAPRWMGLSPMVKGVLDTEYDLLPLTAVTVNPNSTSFGNQLPVGTDGDFLVYQIQWYVVPFGERGITLAPQDIRVRIRDVNGRLFTSDFVQIVDLTGALVPAWPLCKGGVLTFDFQNLNTTTGVNITVVLRGWKRTPCPTQQAFDPGYLPLYRRYTQSVPDAELEDFEYPFTFTATGAEDMLKLPLQTDNDADFLWRGLAGDWNTANNDLATVGTISVTFYDPLGVPLDLYPLINPWASRSAGQFRECVFSNGGGVPAGFFPEVFIPRGGIAQVDISFGGAATLRFSLRGVKVYRQCS